ncbi:hypothetical protein TNCT6_51780 [Streptomyces sp. 6-11-2]|nr:hypothetical protein TNCT6_51780 [Streptomyces sp. 6-11-2]
MSEEDPSLGFAPDPGGGFAPCTPGFPTRPPVVKRAPPWGFAPDPSGGSAPCPPGFPALCPARWGRGALLGLCPGPGGGFGPRTPGGARLFGGLKGGYRNLVSVLCVSPVNGPSIGLEGILELWIATMGAPEPDWGTRIAHEESSCQTRPSH